MTNELAEERAGPGIGHNSGDFDPVDLSRQRVEELTKAAKQWAEIKQIADEETAKRCDDFLNQLTAEIKKLKAEHKVEKEPHQAAARAVDAVYQPLELSLEHAKGLVNPLLTEWLRQKRRAEVEAAASADREPKRAQVRGNYSAKARSLRVVRSAEVEDVLVCFIHFSDHPDVKEVLTKLASAQVRAGIIPPGCRAVEKEIAA